MLLKLKRTRGLRRKWFREGNLKIHVQVQQCGIGEKAVSVQGGSGNREEGGRVTAY